MNALQHTRNELNLCLKENRPDRSYRDILLKANSTKVNLYIVEALVTYAIVSLSSNVLYTIIILVLNRLWIYLDIVL